MTAAHTLERSLLRIGDLAEWQPRPDYVGQHRKRERVELPTDFMPKVGELSPWPPSIGYLSQPRARWWVWLAILCAVAAIVVGAVFIHFAQSPVFEPSLVRAPQTLVPWVVDR